MFAIMSDGSLYGWGGNTAKIKTPTLMDNSHVYVEGWWESDNNQLNNTTKYLVLLADDGYLYRAAVTDASNSLTCSVTILSDNTNYAWLGVKLTHVAAAYHYGTGAFGGNYIIATDGRYLYVAVGGTTVLPSPTIYSLSEVEKIVVGDVAINPSLGFFGAYIIANGDLYCWTPSAQTDTYNIFSSGTTPTVPTLYLSNIIDADISYGIVGVLTSDHNLKVWGHEFNKYASPTTNPTYYSDAVQYSGVMSFSVSAVNYGCIYLDSTGTLYAVGAGQYGRFGLGNSTNYASPQEIVSQTFNPNSALYLTALAAFVADPLVVEIDITFWNSDGSGEVGLIEDVKAIKQMTVGSYFPVPIGLIDVDDESHQVNLQLSTNREFLGLAVQAGGTVVYAAGGSYEVNFSADTNLYVVLGDIPSGDGFDVTFYNNSAEAERVNKTSFLVPSLNTKCTLRHPVNIVNPTITIELWSVPDFNYAYIPAFHRYYYVGVPVSVRNGVWEFELTCDALMSFMSEILAIPNPIIGRCQDSSKQNNMIEDDYEVYDSDVDIDLIQSDANPLSFENTDYNTIIVVSGVNAGGYVSMPYLLQDTFDHTGQLIDVTANNNLVKDVKLVVDTAASKISASAPGTYTIQIKFDSAYFNDSKYKWLNPDGTVSPSNEIRTLTWTIGPQQISEVSLTFNANGGTGNIPAGHTAQGPFHYTIPMDTPTRTGYTFLGWNENANASTAQYVAGDTVGVSSTMILYAIWA